jgi:hypothetical protein
MIAIILLGMHIILGNIMGGGMIIDRMRGKDVRRDERVEEDRGEQYERVDSDNDEDEGDDVNARGLGNEGDDCNVKDSEDRDDIPSIHGSTSSPLHHKQRVQKKGFDTHKDSITKKKERASFIWNNRLS